MIRHLRREQKVYECMWWLSFGIALLGVTMTAITVYFETSKGIASAMMYPSLAIVLMGIVLIVVTGQKIDQKENEIEERLELIDSWNERTSNG